MCRILAAAILVFSIVQASNGYCCFRDPLMLAPKSCPEIDTCGVVKCPKTCASTGPKTCGSRPVCAKVGSTCGSRKCDCQSAYIIGSNTACGCGQPIYLGPTVCDCGVPACSCYRDTANVCNVCEQPSPICSCLRAAGDCGCNCEDMKSFIYFPEVEYPVTMMEVKPFYYGGCYAH